MLAEIVLRLVDPERNADRVYVVRADRELWHEHALQVFRGRAGGATRVDSRRFATAEEVERAARALVRRRLAHGYSVTSLRVVDTCAAGAPIASGELAHVVTYPPEACRPTAPAGRCRRRPAVLSLLGSAGCA
jgi:predicted DNA-binding WGR domain protein